MASTIVHGRASVCRIGGSESVSSSSSSVVATVVLRVIGYYVACSAFRVVPRFFLNTPTALFLQIHVFSSGGVFLVNKRGTHGTALSAKELNAELDAERTRNTRNGLIRPLSRSSGPLHVFSKAQIPVDEGIDRHGFCALGSIALAG